MAVILGLGLLLYILLGSRYSGSGFTALGLRVQGLEFVFLPLRLLLPVLLLLLL